MSKYSSLIDKTMKEYVNQVEEAAFVAFNDWCVSIVDFAVRSRLREGHNYTGNLINSIVVVMHRSRNGKKYAYYVDRSIKKPAICREVSSINRRGNQRTNKIWFKPDWSGYYNTYLRPEDLIPTDKSYGIDDAHEFVRSWSPKTRAKFSIVVAYTSEYAEFVEIQRGTTRIDDTAAFMDMTAIDWVGLKRK